MAIYLDSATLDDARIAKTLGLVEGITTNPYLLSKVNLSIEETIEALCSISGGIVFYQLTESTKDKMLHEAERITGIQEDQIGLKIPCTTNNLGLAGQLVQDGYLVAVTAIFNPAQVLLACQARVKFVIPYVNRSTRILGDGLELVKKMRDVIETMDSEIEIIAASIKSQEEALNAIIAGAHHLTIPLNIIQSMGNDPLSDKTIADFSQYQ